MESTEGEGKEQHKGVVFTWQDMLDLKVAHTPSLVEDLLPQQGIAFLTGPSDTGKSTLVRQLAYEVAQMRKLFLGKKLNTRTGRVIIICTEDDQDNIAAFVSKQTPSNVQEEAKNRLYFIVDSHISLRALDELIDKIGGIDLLIVDVWTDTFYGDLNQTVHVRANLREYKRIAQKYKCLIFCMHHARKGSEGGAPHKGQMLGSQGIEAVARTVLDFRKEGGLNNRVLSITKGNYIADAKKKPMLLTLNEETMLYDLVDLPPEGWGLQSPKSRTYANDKEMYMEVILDLHSRGTSQDMIVQELSKMFPGKKTPSKGTVNTWLQDHGKTDSQSSNP